MTQPAEKPPEMVTFKQVAERIREESGVDPLTLPTAVEVVWFPPPTAGGITPIPVQIRIGEAYPQYKSHNVLAIFDDEEEIRVYTFPGTSADPKNPMAAAPRGYHLSKKAPTYVVKIYPIDALVTAIASDQSLVAYDMTPVERARIEIGAYIRENADKTIADLADDIESGEYEDDEDDDDDDDKEPPKAPAAPNPGVS